MERSDLGKLALQLRVLRQRVAQLLLSRLRDPLRAHTRTIPAGQIGRLGARSLGWLTLLSPRSLRSLRFSVESFRFSATRRLSSSQAPASSSATAAGATTVAVATASTGAAESDAGAGAGGGGGGSIAALAAGARAALARRPRAAPFTWWQGTSAADQTPSGQATIARTDHACASMRMRAWHNCPGRVLPISDRTVCNRQQRCERR
jgi:hypothetical protein